LFADNAVQQLGVDCNLYGYELMGATDAGDVSSILPFAHLSSGGFSGVAHSKSFAVSDERMAYILPAQVMAMTVIDLLYDRAKLARSIKDADQPPLNRQSFETFWEQFNRTLT
ncbi:MAG: hypothetical protein PHR69_09215, partial [Sphaerochaeta sp.]|nr:hypothetical protein [Sphaerochaeta sp.]